MTSGLSRSSTYHNPPSYDFVPYEMCSNNLVGVGTSISLFLN